MIVCQSGLRPGDCVSQVPCPSPADQGKLWLIEAILPGRIAACRSLDPTRDERDRIPLERLMLISRECPPGDAERPGRPRRSRFRIESKDGKTRVTDMQTGADLTSHCIHVDFRHGAGEWPELVITLTDYEGPEVSIEGAPESPPAPRPDEREAGDEQGAG